MAKPGHMKVSRQDVFDLGNREVTPHNAFQLLYYSLAWGLGKRAPYLRQRLDSLADNQDGAADLLVTAWTSMRDGSQPEDVYSILTTNRGGPGASRGSARPFPPSFSTLRKARMCRPEPSSWIMWWPAAWEMPGPEPPRLHGFRRPTVGIALWLGAGLRRPANDWKLRAKCTPMRLS